MGQKTNPLSLRLGITRGWPARWFFRGKYPIYLREDEVIRRIIRSKIKQAGIAAIEIERVAAGSAKVIVKVAKPGIVIGRGGKGIDELVKDISRALQKIRKQKISSGLSLDVVELKRNEISAPYAAQQIAWDLEKRMPFRRTMKKYLTQIMQNKEARGAKIYLSGRLDGAEISRREWLAKGSLPLTTLRSNIDYGQATAFNTYGTVGVKVWIYKGETFKDSNPKSQNTK